MQDEEKYALLRNLTSPIVAITCAWQDRLNGMIANSVIRASLVPSEPRLAAFVLKRNLSHDMIFQSGAFALHLLHAENWDLIWRLGFHSGRDEDKISQFEHRIGATGCPLLEDVHARFDCRVVNAMDVGSSTCFLGQAIDVEMGPRESLMTSEHFRDHMPAEWRPIYEANLVEAQKWAAQFHDEIRPITWRGPQPAS